MARPTPSPGAAKGGASAYVYKRPVHKGGHLGLALLSVAGAGLAALALAGPATGPGANAGRDTVQLGDAGAAAAPGQASERPASASATQQTGAPPGALAQVGPHADFLVRIKDAPAVTAAAKLYGRDPVAASEAFEAWAEGRPAFEGGRLVGGSYSGTVVLRFSVPGRAGQPSADDIQSRLRAADGVAYADLDIMFDAGELSRKDIP